MPLARHLALALALALLLAVMPGTAAAADAPPVSIGVNPPSEPLGPAIDSYTQLAGAAPRIVMWYQSWSEPLFYDSQVRDVAARGATPMVTWSPELSGGAGVPLADIAAGAQDDRVRAAAQLAAAWGKPLLVRFAHEMNLSSSPYGPGVNGNTPADFIAAWRHVVTVFRAAGATNVRWVWTPNVDCGGRCPFEAFYPGDDWVDWVGLDGYNYSTVSGVPWMSIEQVFGPSYDSITRLTSKPLMIAETSSAEAGGDKAAWIRHAFEEALPLRMPAVRAVIWFDRVKETDWRIDSSPSSLAAYRAEVAAPRYAGADVIDPPALPTATPPAEPPAAEPVPTPPVLTMPAPPVDITPAPPVVTIPGPSAAPPGPPANAGASGRPPVSTRPPAPRTKLRTVLRRLSCRRTIRVGVRGRGGRRLVVRRCAPARHRSSRRRGRRGARR